MKDGVERGELEAPVFGLGPDGVRELLEHFPDPTLIVDARGIIVFASLQVERVLGYPPDELRGQRVDRLMPGRFRSAHERHVQGFFAAPVTRPMGPELDLRALTRDGREIPVEISLSGVGSGDSRLVVAILRDVSSQRRAWAEVVSLNRELFTKTAELETVVGDLRVFAQTASHDLQAPLRQISQFLTLLRRRCGDSLSPDGLTYVDCAVQSARHLSELVAKILEYSRIGASERDFAPAALEHVLARVLAVLRAQLEEVSAVVTHDPLPIVRADAAQVEQLLLNLIGNAIRFRGKEALRIHVSAHLESGRWTVSVRDNGVGVEPAHHARIFEMFHRVGTDDARPGSGVGLAICKRVIERHQGRIWVLSEPGLGSTFVFTLPVVNEAIENVSSERDVAAAG